MASIKPHLIIPGRELWDEFFASLHARLTCVKFKPAEMCSDDHRHATEMMQMLATEKGITIDIDGSLAVMRRHGGVCDCKILDIAVNAT